MAEVGHHVFQSNTTQSTTSTTPVVAYTLGTLSTNLDSGGDYMMIVSAMFAATAGGETNNGRRCEIHDNDVLITGTDSRLEPETVVDGEGNAYGVCIRFTKASSGNVTLKIYNTDAINVAVAACEALFIKLDDLTAGTDFLHNANTTFDNDAGGYVDGASITLPASSGDNWVVFGYSHWDADALQGHLTRIVDSAANLAEVQHVSQDVTERICQLTSYAILGTGATKTVKTQYSSGGSGDFLRGEIFVLNLSTFADSGMERGGTALVNAANTWFQLETLSFTAAFTGNYCLMGGGVFAAADVSNARERRITSNINAGGEVVRAGSDADQIVGQSTDDVPFFIVGEVAITSSDSVVIDVDAGDKFSNSQENVGSGWVAAWSWEIDSGVVDTAIFVPTGPLR